MSYVTKTGTSIGNRAAWACIDHPAWGRIGFAGVYGPNDSIGRCGLWAELFSTLDSAYNWFLLGDFNMVGSPQDQKGGDWIPMGGREQRLWAQLSRKFNLQDSFVSGHKSLSYSWDNHRVHRHNPENVNFDLHGIRTLRWLDRIYGPAGGAPRLAVTSRIIPGLSFSDHAPVSATVCLAATTRRPSRFRLNTAHLRCPEYVQRIKSMWELKQEEAATRGMDTETLFNSCLKSTRAIDRAWGKRKATERRAKLALLQSRLTVAQLALELHPEQIDLQQAVQIALENLTAFDKAKAEWVEQSIQSRWLADGDRCSKLFFKSFKGLSASSRSLLCWMRMVRWHPPGKKWQK